MLPLASSANSTALSDYKIDYIHRLAVRFTVAAKTVTGIGIRIDPDDLLYLTTGIITIFQGFS
jgi:hypothetical protein